MQPQSQGEVKESAPAQMAAILRAVSSPSAPRDGGRMATGGKKESARATAVAVRSASAEGDGRFGTRGNTSHVIV